MKGTLRRKTPVIDVLGHVFKSMVSLQAPRFGGSLNMDLLRVRIALFVFSLLVFGANFACLKPKSSVESSKDLSTISSETGDARAYPKGLAKAAYLAALAGDDSLLRNDFWLPSLVQLSAKLTQVGLVSSEAKSAVALAYRTVIALKNKERFSAADYHNTIAGVVCSIERARGSQNTLDLGGCEKHSPKILETVDVFKSYPALVQRHPRVLVLPTFKELKISDFEEIAGLPIVFVGLTVEASTVADGKTMSPRVFFNHDLVHGEQWADEGTNNLFPRDIRLQKVTFDERIKQRVAEREAFLAILTKIKSDIGNVDPVRALFRRLFPPAQNNIEGQTKPLSPVEQIDFFDFYLFHELRINSETTADLGSCKSSCWSTAEIVKLASDHLLTTSLGTRAGRTLRLLGFQTDQEVQTTLARIQKALLKETQKRPR